MTRDAVLRHAARGVAVTIAVAALWDPALTRRVHDRAVVAVTDGAAGAALVARVRARLARDFLVVPGPYLGADALVSVGNVVPPEAAEWRVPAFAVAPAITGPTVDIERVDVPVVAARGTVAPVRVLVRARAARGQRVDVILFAADVPVEQVSRRVAGDDERVEITLGAPMPDSGVVALRVRAAVDGASAPPRAVAVADAVVQVSTRPWRVLFVDPQPSWASTFVRRAVERDARFAVASRIAATPEFSLATRAAPRLGDALARDRFDVIVVGAAAALPAGDIAALDAFMRLRGGSVVLLLDGPATGTLAKLTGVTSWAAREGASMALEGVTNALDDAASAGPASAGAAGRVPVPALRASELVWPSVLPAGAAPMLHAPPPTGSVVWSSPVGAGHLVVSGALDAWRHRDVRESRFDAYWRDVVAGEAARAWPPIGVTVMPPVVRPGAVVTVGVALRTPALAAIAQPGAFSAHSSVSATLGGVRLRLLPDGSTGRLTARARAPSADGALHAYSVIAVAGDASATAPLMMEPGAVRPVPAQDSLVAAWTASRGGRVVGEGDLASLPAALLTAMKPAVRQQLWHPFRSPWWIVPFALLLSIEWYLRRRRSLA